ncbi:MAG TPA: TonB-dependent receptor plug domain-containing protein, partial [Bryobacteraceae bacterium]|nr:TonB-dependent receptor plug domain-containing protein [Bryobacteraceae bacterium]
LNPAREVFEKVDVSYSPPQVDFDRTTPEQSLKGTQVLEIPYPSTNTLRNALRAMPGVTQDSRGGLHVNGGTEEQVLYTLDGFQINDPLTGRFESRLSVESVRAVEVTPLNPAEFGKGAAGTLAIKTSAGDDKMRYSGTNFLPGVENRKGLVLGGWTPRFNVSGPIWKGRAWFSEGFDIQYDQRIVDELPKGQDRGSSWRLGNLLRSQVNIAPSNTLFTSFLWNRWKSGRNGLGVLSPLETTVDQRSRQYFVSVKDQWAFTRSALLEVGYALNRTFGREIPQGEGILFYTPEGERGNAFLDATRKAGRDQFLSNVFLPSFTFLGGHQLKAGVDIDTENYLQDATRTGYVYMSEDQMPLRSVRFGGSGLARRSNTEAASYIQDSWKPRPSILIEAGLRQDWERLLGNAILSPRLGVSWAPPGLESTKISAGYGVIAEQTSLRLLSRPLDQYALTTYFRPDGTIERGPAVSLYTLGPGPLKTPRYKSYSLGIEQRFSSGLYGRLEYIGRRGHDGLTYVNTVRNAVTVPPFETPDASRARTIDALYELSNSRRDVYDGIALTLRQTFLKQYEWLASYTRSRALSNAVLDVSVDDPVLFSSNVGRMPWDAPNRLVSWGYLPTPFENWAIAYLTEVRDGYPFSIQDSRGTVEGDPNRFRYPFFFELNLHLERRFVFHRNRWAFRFGFNNITNHENPNTVNNDVSSPNFMAMYGGQRRALNFRLRWLGKN